MQKSKALTELIEHYHENKLAHAFLIETNDQEKCYQTILTFLKIINCETEYQENCTECNLCHLIANEKLPNLIKIVPDGIEIKKEQIIELKSFFQTKPIFSKYNMYVILNAEKLNSSSANTMLKFIEEPDEGIIGFFITNNKESVIETIKSRCQILLDYYPIGDKSWIPKVWDTIAHNYVKECETVFDEALLYNKDVLMPLIHERKELLYLFQGIFAIYEKLYKKTLNKEIINENLDDLNFILKKGRIYLLTKLNYIIKILADINYNLNINLVLDRFVLEGSAK